MRAAFQYTETDTGFFRVDAAERQRSGFPFPVFRQEAVHTPHAREKQGGRIGRGRVVIVRFQGRNHVAARMLPIRIHPVGGPPIGPVPGSRMPAHFPFRGVYVVYQQPGGQGLVIEALPFRGGCANGRLTNGKVHPALLERDKLFRRHPAQQQLFHRNERRRGIPLLVVQAVGHHRKLVHAARKAVLGTVGVVKVRQAQRMPHLMNNRADTNRLRPVRSPELRGAEIVSQAFPVPSGVQHLPVFAGEDIGMMRPDGVCRGAAGLVIPGVKKQHQVQDAVAVCIIGGEIHLPVQLPAGFVQGPFRGYIPQPFPILHQVLPIRGHGFVQQNRPVNVENGPKKATGVF